MSNDRKTIKHNPLASCWPAYDEDQMQALVEDIQAHGLRNAIVLDIDDQILDGRNRHAACIIAGVEPHFEKFLGDLDAQHAFVMSQNHQRRHMTASQRAMVAGRMLTRLEEMQATSKAAAKAEQTAAKSTTKTAAAPADAGETKSAKPAERPRKTVAKELHVSERSVQDARKVAEKGSLSLQHAVETGVLPVHKAAKLADLPAEQQPAAIDAELAKPRETNSVKPPAKPVSADAGDNSSEILTTLLRQCTASQVVLALVRSCADSKAKSFAKFLREAADTLDPPVGDVEPPADKSGKTPTATRLSQMIPENWSPTLYRAAADWAEYKQCLPRQKRIQSEKAWKIALNLFLKYPEATVSSMVDRAIASSWLGWEHQPADIKPTKSAGVPLRTREVKYDNIAAAK